MKLCFELGLIVCIGLCNTIIYIFLLGSEFAIVDGLVCCMFVQLSMSKESSWKTHWHMFWKWAALAGAKTAPGDGFPGRRRRF